MITSIDKIDFTKQVLSELTTGKKKPKKVKKEYTRSDDSLKDSDIDDLRRAEAYWTGLSDFRERRIKNRKYYRGEQLHELIDDPDNPGEVISEEDYMRGKGKLPFKQNLLRQLGKNVIGQYRTNPSKTIVVARKRTKASITDMVTNAIQYVNDINAGRELDVRNFEENMLSGMAVAKVGYKHIKTVDREDVWFKNMNPNRMFFNNNIHDIRLTDMNFIGELIDIPLDTLLATFAEDKKDEERVKSYYAYVYDDNVSVPEFLNSDSIDNLDFYQPQDTDMCRVVEIWKLKSEWRVYAHDYMDGSYAIVPYTLKEIDLLNKQRIAKYIELGIPQEEWALIQAEEKIDQFWYYKYLTPEGYCLDEGETPYEHQEHPYVMNLYPLIDGEVWGIIEDVIDQQRYINRLISLMDFIMGASAKGVLLVPESVVESDADMERITEEWTKFNGVIKYKPKKGYENQIPKQISANSTNIGIHDMLNLQMKMFQDIFGASSAIQGQTPKSGTPSSLYAQEAQNSMLNMKDMVEYFSWFRQKKDTKILKVIKQFYKEERYLAIAGKIYNEEARLYDPMLVKNLDFDVLVTQGTDTPVYRAMLDDTLMKLLDGGAIDIEMFLENTSLPQADRLLESIRQRKENMMDGQQPVPPELANQIEQGGNPQAQALINQLFNKEAA